MSIKLSLNLKFSLKLAIISSILNTICISNLASADSNTSISKTINTQELTHNAAKLERVSNYTKYCEQYFNEEKYKNAFIYCENGNISNDPISTYYLGMMYKYGYEIPQNTSIAKKLFLDIASNNTKAKYELSEIFYKEGNSELFVKYLTEAANEGLSDAQYNYGAYLTDQNLVSEPNFPLALSWIEKAAKQSNVKAIDALCNIYFNGHPDIERDLSKTISWCEKASQYGSNEADYNLGQIYLAQKDSNKALSYFEKASKDNNSSADVQIAKLYLSGDLGDNNQIKALPYLEQAVNNNNVEALVILGTIYLYEDDLVEIDINKGLDYLEKAAIMGNIDAITNLISLYIDNNNQTFFNPIKAYYWANKLAQNNIPNGYYALGFMYENNIYFDKNMNKAIFNYEKAAELGEPNSVFIIGEKYLLGNDLPVDNKKALHFLMKAANKGILPAQNYIGLFFKNGIEVEQDDDMALSWLNKCAMQDYSQCQYNLGLMYKTGINGEQDINSAIEWFEKASALGNSSAQYELAQIYLDGNVVPQNPNKALDLLTSAAQQGLPQAQNHLAYLFVSGSLVNQDYEQAFHWYEQSALQGDINSANNLALLYLNGNGIEQNSDKSIEILTAVINSPLSDESKHEISRAYDILGQIYLLGLGNVKKNEEVAFYNFNKGSELGNAYSKINLIICYTLGFGTPKDLNKALELLKDIYNNEEIKNYITNISNSSDYEKLLSSSISELASLNDAKVLEIKKIQDENIAKENTNNTNQ